MNMQKIYSVFKCHIPSINGGELPEKFEDLPESDQHDIRDLYRAFILHWVDNEFKAALHDDERVQEAARMLVLAFKAKQDTAIESLKMCIGTFVLRASDHPCVEEGKKMAAEIRKTFEKLLRNG